MHHHRRYPRLPGLHYIHYIQRRRRAIAPSSTVAEASFRAECNDGEGVSDRVQLGRGCTSSGAGGDGGVMWCGVLAICSQTHCDSRI